MSRDVAKYPSLLLISRKHLMLPMSSTLFIYLICWARLTDLRTETVWMSPFRLTHITFPVHHWIHYVIKDRMLQLLYRDDCIYCVEDEHFGAGNKNFWHWRSRCFALETNTLVLESNMLKTCIRSSATHTQLATSDFQTECWDNIIGTHLQNLVASRSGTYLRVCYTHKLLMRNSILCWTKLFSSTLSW